jgi:uncharacterized coiled-coil protein SlyX
MPVGLQGDYGMERQELLNTFNELLETYGKHKSYADKAREQAASFSSSVIEKVIADHQIKASLVADDISPLVPQLSAAIAEIQNAKNEAEQSKGDLGARIEELELRKLIGEISDDEFNEMSSEGRDTVDAADTELESLNTALEELQTALNTWVELSGASVDVDQGATVVADVDEDDEVEIDAVVEAILPGFEDAEIEESVEVEEESVAFDFDDGDVEESVDIVPAEDDPEAAAAVSVDVEEADSDEEGSNVDEIGVDPSEDESDDGSSDNEDSGPRRAILLSNEGTPEEQIYALTGDVFTIGRGRDNDLQIKNDSKVSRFHCKLYRRGANYYLEDNKSSNGTMVNGELIAERRLFGGEELVIGETFFRFRVM